MELNFKKCNNKDLYVLSELSRETFINAFKKQNNPDDFQEYIKNAFSLATLEKELNNPDSNFFFVFKKKELIGYFKLNEFNAQSELKEEEGIELQRIYVINEYQGRNLGSQILLKIMEMANQKEKEYIWLGVWEENLGAIRFYKKHGFIKFNTHPYYIGSDKQTDWLMRKKL